MTKAAAPAKPFVHTPQPPEDCGNYEFFGACHHLDTGGAHEFDLCRFNIFPNKARLTLSNPSVAQATFYVPVELLLPLARKLVDAHHYITSQTKGTDT